MKEIKPDVFRILFDLETREAGADFMDIERNQIRIECDDYNIVLKHNFDSFDLDERILYALRERDEYTKRIRQILIQLDYLRPIIEDIFSYYGLMVVDE